MDSTILHHYIPHLYECVLPVRSCCRCGTGPDEPCAWSAVAADSSTHTWKTLAHPDGCWCRSAELSEGPNMQHMKYIKWLTVYRFGALYFSPYETDLMFLKAFECRVVSKRISGGVCAYSAPTCLSRASTYRGKRRRAAGAIRPEGWMFEPLVRCAVKQSTTALTNASLASDRLEEMERSIAANRYRDRDDVSSKEKQTVID